MSYVKVMKKEYKFFLNFTGCYHSNQCILGVWALKDAIEGLTIKAFSFSEPCGGKSRCDTVSASITYYIFFPKIFS